MFNLYRKSQQAQLNWIRTHPVQYVVLNVVLLVVGFGYIEYRDRKEMREIENDLAQQEN